MYINKAWFDETVNGIKINHNLSAHSSNFDSYNGRDVCFIAVHYTGNVKDLARNNANYFTGARRYASAHFFVDDTSIHQSVKLKDAAYHVGADRYYNSCRNSNSIGIEMCCTAGNYRVSSTTQKNTAYLVAALCKMLGITADKVDAYIVRHYDVTHKVCPAQFVNNPSEWVEFKRQVKNLLSATAVTQKVQISNSVSTLDLAVGVMQGKYGNGEARKNALGNRYNEVQEFINHINNTSTVDLVNEVVQGKYGNGEKRKIVLGKRYVHVQYAVNKYFS